MALPRRIAGERARRDWFQLEDRHTGVLVGRVAAAAAMAAVAALAAPQERAQMPIALGAIDVRGRGGRVAHDLSRARQLVEQALPGGAAGE